MRLISFFKFAKFVYKYISNDEMNPRIVSTSKVQILKCIIVGLKSYLKIRVCFVSNRIPL